MKKAPALMRTLKFLSMFVITLLLIGEASIARSQGSSVTGDPWKMLVIVYREIDVDYIDIDGITKHLSATMPSDDVDLMIQSFLHLPHRENVFDYSDETAELEAHIVFADRPITSVSEVGGEYSYWPSPDDTRPELDSYAPPGMYDSVIIFWQASDPNTGQSIPSGGWGWGYWPGWTYANGMTYATVFNLRWAWQVDPCEGEVFLHEWLHGVTGFYMYLGFPFPPDDLHGAEEAGYSTDAHGCWITWLRDYMRGLVYVDGERTALVPETWQTGSITTYDIQGWRAEYYNDENLTDLPVVVRDDPDINFDWYLDSPHPLVQPDHFSSRWTRAVYFDEGDYEFSLFRDDGVRLWIDDVLHVNKWEWGREQITLNVSLDSGFHDIKMEAFEIDGWASARLSWNTRPNPPSNPSPTDGATNQDINVDLSWTGGDPDPGDTVTYDIYFEANDDTPGNLICDDVSTPACDPGALAYGTHYYWYVVATDNRGASTTGATWDFATNSPPTISGLPDQTLPVNTNLDNAIDLWAYANDAESADSELTFTIDNTPDPSAGVSIDSNRYIDINPTPGWTGQTNITIRVTDPGGLSDTDTFRVEVELPAPPAITSITPNSVNNNEVVHITNLAGSDFQSGATVRLIKTGQADIVATNVVVVSSSQITCDLDLRGATPGQWTVRVTNPDTQEAELADGFTVKRLVYLPLILRNR
jgi:hypothetical protein